MLQMKKEGDKSCLISRIKPETLFAITVANSLMERLFPKLNLVVTSITDSHEEDANSLHNYGYAFDMRIRDFPPAYIETYLEQLRRALSDEYTIVLEETHIHVEFDPEE